MRLHIARNRVHARLIGKVFPEDEIIVHPDMTRGLRVEAIIEWPQEGRTSEQWVRYWDWFDQAVLTRLEPNGEVLRV